ncbi:MAG: DUF3225 domain-containing protein [Planctomycetes bacterium]|nr:DUF3225 domain-containing protein [Planctomycetota bacterium]
MSNHSNLSNFSGMIQGSMKFVILAIFFGALGGSVYADDPDTLHATVNRQADAWNRGDLDAFMEAYWKSPKLTFSSGGETTRGWEETLARYRKRYPDRETMGKLRFSELETQMLGPDAALTLGRWNLDRQEPAQGNFSLVWRKLDGAWRIVHDHSSSSKTP